MDRYGMTIGEAKSERFALSASIEMQPSNNGDWILYKDYEKELNVRDQYITQLEKKLEAAQRFADKYCEQTEQLEEKNKRLTHIDGIPGKNLYIVELETLIEDCKSYLKENETPAQCIKRNRDDMGKALEMFANERLKVEALEMKLEILKREADG